MRRQTGFSIIELVVSMGLMLGITAAVFAMLNPSHGSFAVEPEVADMQQRVRVSADTLAKDLVMAGGGAYQGQNAGSLAYFFATVLPYRRGKINPDPVGTFKTDTISILYVPPTQGQTSICVTDKNNDPCGMPGPSAELKTVEEPGCPVDPATGKIETLCSFEDGMDAMIYDATGSYDTFTITAVQDDAGTGGHIQHNLDNFSKAYQPGARIVQMASHTYYLKTDVANKTYQLMHYGGGNGADVPLVDNVVALAFDYYGEARPAMRNTKPLTDSNGPWTTYGPRPPALAVQETAYPAGENCVFKINAGNQVPRLDDLSNPANPNGLVKLTAAQLTDGPWCPDAVTPSRWDADLLRIRKIGVRIRVMSSNDALRGPASMLFTYAGTAKAGSRYAPDQEIQVMITPRNLNLGR